MKTELQQYLTETFGEKFSNINAEFSIGGPVFIRFELGYPFENGTKKRVNQATDRAIDIFSDTFDNDEEEIWFLIYEYLGKSPYGETNEFLYKQFPKDAFRNFYNKIEPVDNGNSETNEVKIIIGKVKVKDINYKNIFNAIANTEMGFDPALNERVFFINPNSDKIFYMYDDRGCLVFSNDSDKIKPHYEKRIDWVAEYDKSVVDSFFKNNSR